MEVKQVAYFEGSIQAEDIWEDPKNKFELRGDEKWKLRKLLNEEVHGLSFRLMYV